MTVKPAYIIQYPTHTLLRVAMFVCLLLLLLLPANSYANKEDEAGFDEIAVMVSIQGVGTAELPAIIRNETGYLCVNALFDYLRIKNTLSTGLDSITGAFIDPKAFFLIDKVHNNILFEGKKYQLKESDMIRTEMGLYLQAGYLGEIFGLECRFNFRSLSFTIVSKAELPIMREMRQEAMRSNMRQLKGEIKADTTILRRYPLFRFGMADWSVISTIDGQGTKDTRLNLALGTVLAGGEMNMAINYSNNIPFSERQQYYQWRRVNNESAGLRQVMAGKIIPQSVSSIYFPVVGVQFTNTPTTYRRSFGTYLLSDRTEPGWTVELYVNNVLVDYVKADASGFFTFEVPLVYGNSSVKLRHYGPWGEERFTEQNISIPFNFMPLHQLEYTVSAGIVEDSLGSRFSRANANYGLTKHITIGAGAEYLSSVTSGKSMPFVNASVRIAANLLFYGEYTYNVRAKGILNYRLPSNLQFELNYTRYKKGQTAINNTYLEERKAVISYPFRSSRFSAFSRLTLYQIVLPSVKYSNKYTTVEGLFSAVAFGVNANITTYALYTSSASPYVYSNFSVSFRLPSKLIVTPQAQYEYSQHNLISIKGEVGKYLSAKGFLNMFYEKNFKSNVQNIGVGLRFDLSFAQVGFSARRSNHVNSTIQSASGSLLYDDKTKHVDFNNRTSVGRGGIALIAFLDLNGNNVKDEDEPRVPGLNVEINAGRIRYDKADTLIRIFDLEAYTNYIIKLKPDFDNITWQVQHRTIGIIADPNQFKIIEVPVHVQGEVSGTVLISEKGEQKGLGRIIVNFIRNDGTSAGQTLTESDGFFSFTGLKPGTYTARIDAAQLRSLGMTAAPEQWPFTIEKSKDGTVADNLRFVLQLKPTALPAAAVDN